MANEQRLFEVTATYGDTCGNESSYPLGVFRADSEEDVRKVFSYRGMFCDFKIEEFQPLTLPTQVVPFPDERNVGRLIRQLQFHG